MKKPVAFIAAVLAAMVAVSAGCNGGSSAPPPPPISVAFMPAPPASLQATTTAMLTAVVSNDSSNAGVDWSVTCGSAGACGSFSPTHTASGSATTYTAPAAVPTGNTVTVTATSTANSTGFVSASITITSPAITVAFMPAPPSSVQATTTAMLTAVVSNDSSNAGVDWSVTCGSAGACGSFSPTHTASGSATTYTAPAAVPTGNTVTVTATSTANSTKSVSATITITPPPITVTVSPPNVTMSAGSSAMFTATVSNTTNVAVTWTLSGTGCTGSACGTLSSTTANPVTYTAPGTPPSSNLTVTITATSAADTTKSASATITVLAITVSFSSAVPSSLIVSTTAMLTAVVSNDPSTAGVDWSVTCRAGACGSFSAPHTASGIATTYTAPAASPAGNTVTVTATSTADTTKKATANITVGKPLAAGKYVFNFTGVEVSTGSPYSVAGVFTSDGTGKITGGEQDFSDLFISATPDPITSGSNAIGPDGRGTISLVTPDTSVGVSGKETLSVVFVSTGTQGFVTEFDSFGSASGTINPQTLTTFTSSTLAKGFAFAMLGTDFFPLPLTWGGVLNINNSPSPGGISGAGSVSDEDDAGTVNLAQTVSGTVSAPDTMGRVVFSLNTGFVSGITISGYIVDAAHVKLVETDGFLGVTGGTAVGQGAKTGTFGNSDLSGTAVFNGSGAVPAGSLAAAGLVTANATGSITAGILDVESAGTHNTTPISGTYTTVSVTGRSVITLNSNPAGLTTFVTYLVGGGNPSFVLNMDPASLTSGLAFAQSGTFTASTFTGNYGFGAQNFLENLTGQFAADGVSSLSGNEDLNEFFGTLDPSTIVTGTFTAHPNGQFPGSFNSSVTGSFTVDFFLASGSLGVFVETDSSGQRVGIFVKQ